MIGVHHRACLGGDELKAGGRCGRAGGWARGVGRRDHHSDQDLPGDLHHAGYLTRGLCVHHDGGWDQLSNPNQPVHRHRDRNCLDNHGLGEHDHLRDYAVLVHNMRRLGWLRRGSLHHPAGDGWPGRFRGNGRVDGGGGLRGGPGGRGCEFGSLGRGRAGGAALESVDDGDHDGGDKQPGHPGATRQAEGLLARLHGDVVRVEGDITSGAPHRLSGSGD